MVARRRSRCRILVVAAWCLFVRAAAAESCPIPLQPTRTAFAVSVRIGAAGPYRFLFDTASSITTITPRVAAEANAAVTGKTRALTTTGEIEAGRGTVEQVQVGRMAAGRLAVLVLPLPSFPSHGRVDGILGANFLAGRSYLIDLRSRCLRLGVGAERIGGGSVLAAEEVAGRVAFKVRHGREELRLTLDSAASFTVLTSPRAASLAHVTTTADVRSAAGRETRPAGTIERLLVGDVELRRVPAAVVLRRDADEDALLPATLFSRIFVSADRRSAIVSAW